MVLHAIRLRCPPLRCVVEICLEVHDAAYVYHRGEKLRTHRFCAQQLFFNTCAFLTIRGSPRASHTHSRARPRVHTHTITRTCIRDGNLYSCCIYGIRYTRGIPTGMHGLRHVGGKILFCGCRALRDCQYIIYIVRAYCGGRAHTTRWNVSERGKCCQRITILPIIVMRLLLYIKLSSSYSLPQSRTYTHARTNKHGRTHPHVHHSAVYRILDGIRRRHIILSFNTTVFEHCNTSSAVHRFTVCTYTSKILFVYVFLHNR